MSKCLGAMDDIVLLTRIHPMHPESHNPLEQAYKWFGLISDTDLERLQSKEDWPYTEIIQMISERAEKAGKILIVGDLSTPDFVADKPVTELAGTLIHASALETRFDVKSAALIRHPIDHWIDLQNAQGEAAPSIEIFLRGLRRFATNLEDIETVKFEDFLSEPVPVLTRLCDLLDAPYDAGWTEKWREFDFVAVEPLDPRTEEVTFDDELLAAFNANSDFEPTVKLLGYDAI